MSELFDGWTNDLFSRAQRSYDREEPPSEDETIDEDELARRETEYQSWIKSMSFHLNRLTEFLSEPPLAPKQHECPRIDSTDP